MRPLTLLLPILIAAPACSRSSAPTTPAAGPTQPAPLASSPESPSPRKAESPPPEPTPITWSDPTEPKTVDKWLAWAAEKFEQYPADKATKLLGPARPEDVVRWGGQLREIWYPIRKTLKDEATGTEHTYKWLRFDIENSDGAPFIHRVRLADSKP